MKENVTGKKNTIRENAVFILSSLLAGFALTFRFTEGDPFWAYGKVSLDFFKARIFSGLGDYQFDMMIASVMCGAAIYYVKDKFAEYIRGYVLPFILGSVIVLGRSAAQFGNLYRVFGTLPFIIRTVLASAGFGVILRLIFALFEAGLKKASIPGNGWKIFEKIFGENIFRNVFLILIALWLPVTILNYPGNYNADFIGQMMQTTGGMPWSVHHPIVLTALIGIWFRLFGAVFGNYDLGLFAWILLQECALASALSLTLKELKKRGAGIPLLTLVFGIYVLSPIYSNIVTTAIKDVFFISAVIWYLLLVTDFYDDEKAFLDNKKKIVKICLAAFLVCMCRNNGSIIIFVNGIVMSVYAMGKAHGAGLVKKALIFMILPLGIYTAFSSGIKTAVNAESDGLKEMLSIPMQQTALYMTRYQDELTSEEIDSINALFGNYLDMIESYDPTISDPVKQYYDTSADSKVVSGYLLTWTKMLFKHPGTYFESFFLSVYGWFDPETDTSIRYEGDSELFTRTGLFEGADEILIFAYRYIDRISFFGMLQSPGLWTWIMILLIRRRKGGMHMYVIQLISLLVCMAGPCFMKHARYAFPIMFTIPFMMGYEGLIMRGEKE